jgi:spore germination cell wall hydrolase CwlJ-like protein
MKHYHVHYYEQVKADPVLYEKMKDNQKQYYEQVKAEPLRYERIKENNKQYKETNKQRIKENRFMCMCGSDVSKYERTKHFASKKHQNYLCSLN